MKILSFDPGTKNLGVTLINYVGATEAETYTIPKNHDACKANNYEILWVGVFDVGNKSSSHEENVEKLSRILQRNKFMKAFMEAKDVKDVVFEIQEGENNHNVLRGLMRPNWVSGFLAGYCASKGKRSIMMGKTNKWGWTTFKTFQNNANRRKEARKNAIAIYIRYLSTLRLVSNQVIDACRNNNNSILTHVGDSVVQGMSYIRREILRTAYPLRKKYGFKNVLTNKELTYVKINRKKRKW